MYTIMNLWIFGANVKQKKIQLDMKRLKKRY